MYRYILYPTDEQKVMLEKTFKCCRDVHNELLHRAINTYEDTHSLNGIRGDFKEEKWNYLKEVDRRAISGTISSTAFNFMMYIKDKHSKEFKPEYITDIDDQMYRMYNDHDDIVITEDTISLPKIGVVKLDVGNNTIPEDKRVSSVSVHVRRNNPDYEYSVFVLYQKDLEKAISDSD